MDVLREMWRPEEEEIAALMLDSERLFSLDNVSGAFATTGPSTTERGVGPGDRGTAERGMNKPSLPSASHGVSDLSRVGRTSPFGFSLRAGSGRRPEVGR
jgi:hypothetical protein